MISYFSGKSLNMMSPDALISAQNAPKCVWQPGFDRIRWGAHSALADSLAKSKGFYFYREGSGQFAQFCIQI